MIEVNRKKTRDIELFGRNIAWEDLKAHRLPRVPSAPYIEH